MTWGNYTTPNYPGAYTMTIDDFPDAPLGSPPKLFNILANLVQKHDIKMGKVIVESGFGGWLKHMSKAIELYQKRK